MNHLTSAQILKFLFWNRVLLSYPGWLWTHSVVNCRPWTFHPSVSFSWVVGIAGPLPCPVRENICVKVSIQEPGVMPFLICLAHSSREGSPSGPGKRNGPWSQTETRKMKYQFKIFFLFLFLFSPDSSPHSGRVFPSQLNLTEETLTDSPKAMLHQWSNQAGTANHHNWGNRGRRIKDSKSGAV